MFELKGIDVMDKKELLSEEQVKGLKKEVMGLKKEVELLE